MRNHPTRRRRSGLAAAALLLTSLSFVGQAPPSDAAAVQSPEPADLAAVPPRADAKHRPVYFVHGYARSGGHDCSTYWGSAWTAMRSWGFTGPFHTVKYYAGDENCNTDIGDFSQDHSIRALGRELALEIYNTYSQQDIAVDVMTHSMGGLIARAAIYGTNAGWTGYPPYVYIEDVATLSTPHLGINVNLGVFCGNTGQCLQMKEGSDFLTTLGHNPSSASGTDWTLLGSEGDLAVRTWSSLGMDGAGHKVNYPCCTFDHSNMTEVSTGAYNQLYWNYWDPGFWYQTSRGAPPLRSAANALYYWWKW